MEIFFGEIVEGFKSKCFFIGFLYHVFSTMFSPIFCSAESNYSLINKGISAGFFFQISCIDDYELGRSNYNFSRSDSFIFTTDFDEFIYLKVAQPPYGVSKYISDKLRTKSEHLFFSIGSRIGINDS